ncbi:putative ubiquitinyl hydrolase 1 [Helianthus anomalus]
MILCGRKLWDGSGGNNHAIEHYNETHYPLAVKLGTITSDPEGAGNVIMPIGDCTSHMISASVICFFKYNFEFYIMTAQMFFLIRRMIV